MRYVLDTDHISLLQRRHPHVVRRLASVLTADRVVTIISVDEQLQGRLAVIRRAKTQIDAARGYERLRETLAFYSSVQILPYDAEAVEIFEEMRRQDVRIGTQDLRIAAIVLRSGATLVTRNIRDFRLVSGLSIEDWSLPTSP